MKQDLSYKRKVYEKQAMNFDSLRDNPIEQFRDWFIQAEESDGVDEANAMSVATIGNDGFPRTRVVLLKRYTDEGFIFYTNYNSQKGEALLANPNFNNTPSASLSSFSYFSVTNINSDFLVGCIFLVFLIFLISTMMISLILLTPMKRWDFKIHLS